MTLPAHSGSELQPLQGDGIVESVCCSRNEFCSPNCFHLICKGRGFVNVVGALEGKRVQLQGILSY